MAWTALPTGDDLALQAGEIVAVVASVKASHSAADLAAFAAKRGLTVTDYAEEGQRPGLGPDPRGPGYRYVEAIATVGQGVSLPWSVPFPLSILDSSQLVHAWVAPQGAAPGPAPAPLPPTPAQPPATVPGGGVVILAWAAIGTGLLLWERRRRWR